MKSFDSSLTDHFDQALLLREQELCALLDARESLIFMQSADAHDVRDLKDIAAAQSQTTVDEAQVEQVALELEQVLSARARLQDRSYGRCLACAKPIDLNRLSVMPAAAYCTACKTSQEKHDALTEPD